jgi:glycosyltransferase involved in cell wall biosynthesis
MSDLEIIVVDDGSRDNTGSWIHTIRDPRVRYYKLAENRGPARARNVGISCCRGQLVAFLDSEDAWMEDKLAKQLRILEVEKTDACLCGFVRLNRGNRRQTISYWPRELRSCLHFECPFSPGSTLVMSKQTVNRIGGFDENLRRYEDWEYLLRIAGVCRVSFVPDPLALVFMGDTWEPEIALEATKEFVKKTWRNFQATARSAAGGLSQWTLADALFIVHC